MSYDGQLQTTYVCKGTGHPIQACPFRCTRFAAMRASPKSRADDAAGLSADTLALLPEDVAAPQAPSPHLYGQFRKCGAPTLFIHVRHSKKLNILWRTTPPGNLRRNMLGHLRRNVLGRPLLHAHTSVMRTQISERTQVTEATQQSGYTLQTSSWFHSTKLRELPRVYVLRGYDCVCWQISSVNETLTAYSRRRYQPWRA